MYNSEQRSFSIPFAFDLNIFLLLHLSGVQTTRINLVLIWLQSLSIHLYWLLLSMWCKFSLFRISLQLEFGFICFFFSTILSLCINPYSYIMNVSDCCSFHMLIATGGIKDFTQIKLTFWMKSLSVIGHCCWVYMGLIMCSLESCS